MDKGISEGNPVFDLIADYYDETREPLRKDVLGFLIDHLTGMKEILEVGVGTGRVAIPLQEAGFDITGIDISEKMLDRARHKGLRKAFIADARKIPFPDESFDATIIVHVFHLLNNRKQVLEEALRVSRREVLSIIRIGDSLSTASQDQLRGRFMEILKKVLADHGIDAWENSSRWHRGGFESSVLEEIPSNKLLEIGHFKTVMDRDQIARRMIHSSRYVQATRDMDRSERIKIEEEFLRRVQETENFSVTRKSREFMAVWDKNRVKSQ